MRHPDCCLSLSSPLIERIISTMSGRRNDGLSWTILSVGSGSGLLEYLVMINAKKMNPYGSYLVDGVEVQQPESQPSVNKYLPEAHRITVQTTSTVSPRLCDKGIKGLMFVYPRQMSLVRQYLAEVWEGKTHVETIVWLGPRADWDDFSPCFDSESSSFPQKPQVNLSTGTEAGLDDYELMAVVRLHRGVDP